MNGEVVAVLKRINHGRPRIYTYGMCKQEAEKCRTRNELYFANRRIYEACLRNGWLDEFFPPVERTKARMPELIEFFNLLDGDSRGVKKVAHVAGVSQYTMSKWRNAKTTPGLYQFVCVLAALGYKIKLEPLTEDKVCD